MSGGGSGSIPLEGEAGRAFLQRRVAGMARIVGGVGILFGLVSRLRGFPWIPGEFVLPVLLLGISVATTRRAWSRAALHRFDEAVTIASCVGFCLVLHARGILHRADLFALLVLTNFLVTRSVLVPSTGWRTLVLSTVAAAPIIPLTYVAYLAQAPGAASSETFGVAQWTALAVGLSAANSRRLYGLARRVEEARRLGQYTLEVKIGEGGMGEVYLARHAMLRRPTAVKLLPASLSSEADIARFEREVQLTSQLAHPNTIQIYDFGRADDGTFYYAMEYLEGLTLADLVTRYGAQPPGRVARILADVCGSLTEAHEAGLVHRDIKPHNVMLCARAGLYDVVKVLDFGLVRSVGGPGGKSATAHLIAGTPEYMAPEAIFAPETTDGRSDLYAVGAVAYYLLTGSEVFSGDTTFTIFGKHLYEAPERLSKRAARRVPGPLEDLVLACLAKSPRDRPQTARGLRDALLAIAADEPPFDLAGWWAGAREQRPDPRHSDTGAATTRLLSTVRRDPRDVRSGSR